MSRHLYCMCRECTLYPTLLKKKTYYNYHYFESIFKYLMSKQKTL